MSEAQEAVVLQPGEGNSSWLHDNLVTLKATSEDTAGSYSLTEMVVPSGGGPPLHTHSEEESLYILEGEMIVKIGERTFKVGTGSFILVPKHTPHTFLVEGDGPAKLLLVFSPPGFENFFFEAGRPAEDKTLPPPPGGPPSPEEMEKMIAISEKYGSRVVGPPLGQ